MKKALGFLLFTAFVVLIGTSCIRYVPYGGPGSASGPYDDQYGDRYDRADRYDDLDSAYFYDELQPYGLWVSYRPYGYVWVPRNVGYSWRPYTRGHWAYTDYGWTWVSLESWGWICFHYGRWGWDRRMGWFWVPDNVWGPSWVAWRWGDTHIGWAPLPPGADFIPGRGFGRRSWDIPGNHWCFVRGRDFMDRRLERWVLPAERNLTIVNLTRFEVNIDERDRRIYNQGLDPDVVRRQVNRPVDRLTLKDSTRPGPAREEGGELVVSKPVIRRNEAAKPKQVLDEDRAEREINSEAAGRIYRRPTDRNQESVLRQTHEQERKLMEESQRTELEALRRKAQEEGAKVRNPDDKKKIETQAEGRAVELRRKHQQEKTELEKRQKDEESKVKRTPVRKKVEKRDDRS